jgi:hypothetical protein
MSDFNDAEPDGPLTPEEETRVLSLTPADFKRIDECLLSHASHSWHKVARVVLHAMFALRDEFPTLPDGFYSMRVKHLVASGALEAAGNLDRMRFSEVRIPGSARTGVDQ